MSDELANFFKALADPNRLKILGLLSQRDYSGEELAALLNLKASTISHHLGKLIEAGLILVHAEGYYNRYELDRMALESARRSLFTNEQMASAAGEIDADAYGRKVLADFLLPDGRLKTIPAQRKKLEVVLRHIARAFEPGIRYNEKQVNDILGKFHSDTATLRRELLGYQWLDRVDGGGEYWKKERRDASASIDPE